MAAITDKKNELVSLLGGICTVYPYIAARPTPPCITINTASPYIEDDITFGSYKVNFSLELTMPTQANDKVTEDLDARIEDVVVELVNAGYLVLGVSAPYALEANNTQYLSVSITCSTVVSF